MSSRDEDAMDRFGLLLARHRASRLLRAGDRVVIHHSADPSTGVLKSMRAGRAEVEQVDGTRRWYDLWQLWLITDTEEAANRFLTGHDGAGSRDF